MLQIFVNVRFGSEADILRMSTDVGFTPDSGHQIDPRHGHAAFQRLGDIGLNPPHLVTALKLRLRRQYGPCAP
jgi:hypothetical protein